MKYLRLASVLRVACWRKPARMYWLIDEISRPRKITTRSLPVAISIIPMVARSISA